jgi:hypothetical protein
MVIVVIKKIPMLMGLVLELHHRDSHTLGSRLDGRINRVELSPDVLIVSKRDGVFISALKGYR